MNLLLNQDTEIGSDELLLQQAKAGDVQAFESIYAKRKNKLYSYLLTLLNYTKDDAQQVLSEVFITLYEHNKSHTILNCKNFLYTIAHNKAIDWMKAKSLPYESVGEREVDVEDLQQKHAIHLEYQQQLLTKYLSFLPSKEREVIYLYFYESKSYDEIAIIMGSNKNTIGTLLSEAKRKIKEFSQRDNITEFLSV